MVNQNKKMILLQDVKDVITKMEKYYNYDPSDMVTHVKYVKQTSQEFHTRGACTWQSKIRNGENILLTNDWFETNIEYGQNNWYCNTVGIGKKIQKVT